MRGGTRRGGERGSLFKRGRRRYSPAMFEWLSKVLKKPPQRDPLADRGESAAARYLKENGYKVLIRNFRCDLGEIDIIARQGDTLVFVEVKTRVADEPTPEQQVNEVKRHQITKAAKFYLSRYARPYPPARFDVIAIVWPTGRE